MSAVLIVAVCVFAASGAAVGYFRKFSKTSSWGVSTLLTMLIVRLIGSSVKKTSGGYALSVIISAVVILLILTLCLKIFQKCVAHAVESRKRLSHYKNLDDLEENEAHILNALDNGDKRSYKKQLKKRKKIKDKAGAWGIVDGVLGAVFSSLNFILGIGIVIIAVLMFADISQIGFLQNLFATSLNSSSWAGLGKAVALDLPLISVLAFSVRAGYKSGLSSVISIVVVVGLLIGFGAASYSIACTSACESAVNALVNGPLASLSGVLGDKTAVIARVIIAAVIYLLSLVIIILVAVFLPKLCEKLRENKFVFAIDGVAGALVLCGFVLVLIMLVGGVAGTLKDLEFMQTFNAYANGSHLGDALFTYNPFGDLFSSLPLAKWLTPAEPPADTPAQ